MAKYMFILLICITSKVYSQAYFPDSNAIWNVNYINSVGTPTDEMYYGLKGDTIMNGVIYNKLYTLSDTTMSIEHLQDYIGGFRIEGQKVWFKPAYWSNQDILLYDFSVSVGDTVWHKGIAYDEFNFDLHPLAYSVIQEINTDNVIKTYSIIRGTDGLPGEWYEDIGSNFGLLGSIIQFPLVGDTYHLACCKHNDTVKYQNNLMCNQCFCGGPLTAIEVQEDNMDWIKISPNPIQNLLTINIERPYLTVAVMILDARGMVIYKKESLDSSILLNNVTSGIYLLKLLVDNQTVMRKIIIE